MAAATDKSLFSGAIAQKTVETTARSFADLGLSGPIVEVLEEAGFTHPTAIQADAIPPALEGRDLIGLAETGSGKTAAFCLPIIQGLDREAGLQGLIVCPTREIALQTEGFLELFRETLGLRAVSLIGGMRIGPQIDALRQGAQIAVVTPGRLLDHAERGTARLDGVGALVLDEADHLLDMGFLPQISRILRQLPERRQNFLFSATMPQPIQRLTRRVMQEPVWVDHRPEGSVAEGIEHRLYLVRRDDMKACLLAIVDDEPGSMLIFLPRKIDAEWANRQLQLDGHPVGRIHGDRSQRQRVEALSGLREGEHRVLIATDIAARGIDLPMVRHIVNFGMPDTVEDYVHRAGRTARGTAKGVVSTIATWRDKAQVERVERTVGVPLERCRAEGVEAYEELDVRRRMSRRGKLPVKRKL